MGVKCEEHVDELNITCEIVSYCSGHEQLSYEWNSIPGKMHSLSICLHRRLLLNLPLSDPSHYEAVSSLK